MAKVARKVGKIAALVGAVALIGTGVGAALGGTMLLTLGGLSVSAATIATVAGAVSALAGTVSELTAKPPTARGQVNDRLLGANNPLPYLIGRSYSGGVQVHDVGYGGLVSGVQNPYRFMVTVHSCCGPVEGLEAVQADFVNLPFSSTAATGYYSGYLYRDYQLGARPEADALAAQWGTPPEWGSGYKLSSMAALALSLKWDKDGKKFAGGQLPVLGSIWQGVKVYDPRLDDTYPGGSGAHRIDDEDTWEYSQCPALHSLAYGYGRYVNGVKVFGVDLGSAAIRLDQAVAWANVCDANGWTVNGTIFEPGDKWNNLKRIAEAGAGEPVLAGGLLGFDFQAPRTALASIGTDDLADGQLRGRTGRGFKAKHNTLVARYRSEDHKWTYQQAAAVSEAAFVTADSEIKSDERQWDLVTDVDQVTELAIYDLWQRREGGPYSVPCKPHMRIYGPGDCLTLLEETGIAPPALGDVKCVIRRRTIDPATGVVNFELEQESDGKHTAALGTAGVAPPAPALPTGQDIDEATTVTLTPATTLYEGDDKFKSDSSLDPVNATSFAAVSDVLTLDVGAGETLFVQASLDYGVSGNGARTAEIKAEISPAGAGTWSDFDLGSATGTAAQGLASIYELGHVDYTDEAAGLSAGSYDVRLSAALDAAGLTVSFIGSVYFNVA